MSARMRRAFAAALCLFAVAAAPASAAQPDCTGRGVPVNKISIQEYTFAGFQAQPPISIWPVTSRIRCSTCPAGG